MASVQLRAFLQQLRRVVGPHARGGLTDAELLERFVSEKDEAAFEVLVWRHGSMVVNVCRRLLRREQDVEDAFQATFLALVRKARSIGKREALASWLYKVAYRTALEAGRLASKRNKREQRQDTDTLEAKTTEQPADVTAAREFQVILDEEVNRLPEKYRTPVVLCYFEGKSYEEAARELGCPKGTLSIRLLRARELLRPRLARRGLALTSGALVALSPGSGTTAAISKSLVESTVKAAFLFAAAKTTAASLSGQAVALAEGVLRAMFLTKLKTAAVLLLVVGLACTGAGVLTFGGALGEKSTPPAEQKSKSPLKQPQEQKAESLRPDGKAISPDANRTAPEPKVDHEPDRKRLQAAQDARIMAESAYREQEDRWIQQSIRARVRVLDLEDDVKDTEAEFAQEIEEANAKQKSTRGELEKLKEQFQDKNHPAIQNLEARVRMSKQRLHQLKEARRQTLMNRRLNLFQAEEELRLLERMQSIRRDAARRKFEAAEERVSRLQQLSSGGEPATEGPSDLEKKIDKLLRDVTELRREILRAPTEKRQQPALERRPDQP